jgi:hypothetical protein
MKKPNQVQRRRLAVNAETVRRLTPAQLERCAGGIATDTQTSYYYYCAPSERGFDCITMVNCHAF